MLNAPMRSRGPGAAGGAALAAVAFAALAPAAAAQPAPTPSSTPAGDYVLDPDRSSLRITLGFAGGLGAAVVRFTRLDGGFAYPAGAREPSQVKMNVDTTSATGTPWTRRAALAALDAARWPRATFVSERIEMVGADAWAMAGRLTLRGVTRPLTLQVSLAPTDGQAAADGEQRLRFVGRGHIRRSEYGLHAPVLTRDQMDLRFDVEFARRAD